MGQLVGLLEWGISLTQGLYLDTGQRNKEKHGQYMPQTTWPLGLVCRVILLRIISIHWRDNVLCLVG